VSANCTIHSFRFYSDAICKHCTLWNSFSWENTEKYICISFHWSAKNRAKFASTSFKCTKNASVVEVLTRIPLEELTALPRSLAGFKGALRGEWKGSGRGKRREEGKTEKTRKKKERRETEGNVPIQNKYQVTALTLSYFQWHIFMDVIHRPALSLSLSVCKRTGNTGVYSNNYISQSVYTSAKSHRTGVDHSEYRQNEQNENLKTT